MAKERRRLSAQQALEWAFQRECAELCISDRPDSTEEPANVGNEYIMMQRAMLGGVRIDTSGGRSYPHEDAEAIAAILSNLPDSAGGIRQAIALSEMARSGLTPDWMPGAVPKIEPKEWHNAGWAGKVGKTETLSVIHEEIKVPHPRNPAKWVTRRRRFEARICPCFWNPHPQEIVSARSEYERWWRALDEVRINLQAAGVLATIEITDQMPPRSPWLTARRSANVKQNATLR